jgi:8-hydroxy-5-deazaflavin:NADPH oxidoreductase
MRLAIIGAGNVGGTLGTAWAQKAGHEIFFGVRNPTSDQTQAVVRRLEGRARAGTPAQVVSGRIRSAAFLPAWCASAGTRPGKFRVDCAHREEPR